MATLVIRTGIVSHHNVNPHIRREEGESERYMEFSHLGILVNGDLTIECIARDVVAARLAGQPLPTYSVGALKEAIKVHLRAWGTVGVKLWREGLSDEDQREVLDQAATIATASIPELYGLEPIPPAPKRERVKKEDTEVVEAVKPPADDLTPADLNDMSRSDLLAELKARGVEVDPKTSANKAKALLLEHLTPVA